MNCRAGGRRTWIGARRLKESGLFRRPVSDAAVVKAEDSPLREPAGARRIVQRPRGPCTVPHPAGNMLASRNARHYHGAPLSPSPHRCSIAHVARPLRRRSTRPPRDVPVRERCAPRRAPSGRGRRVLGVSLRSGATGDRLYLLGDVFDLWLGDDDDRRPHPEVEVALAETVAAWRSHRPDPRQPRFPARRRIRRTHRLRARREPLVIEVGGERAVLLHGDTLCTRDVEYQAFRHYARDPGNQRPSSRVRSRSGRAKRPGSAPRRTPGPGSSRRTSWTSPTKKWCGVLSECAAARMIHGHTHRPAIHELDLDVGPATRIVLGDWYDRGTVLVWDGGRLPAHVTGETVGLSGRHRASCSPGNPWRRLSRRRTCLSAPRRDTFEAHGAQPPAGASASTSITTSEGPPKVRSRPPRRG